MAEGAEVEPPQNHETRERSRGRDEIRRCSVLTDLSYLTPHQWPGLESIAKITAERTISGHTTREVRYYLCSFKAEASEILHAVRSHWGVENKLHWALDVIFNEDQHSLMQKRGAENMSVLRQLAINLLRQVDAQGSLKGKRKEAAWDDAFRSRVLLGLLPTST